MVAPLTPKPTRKAEALEALIIKSIKRELKTTKSDKSTRVLSLVNSCRSQYSGCLAKQPGILLFVNIFKTELLVRKKRMAKKKDFSPRSRKASRIAYAGVVL
jgi:hypothetical protein